MGDQKMLRDVSDMLTKILLESALTKRIGVAFNDYRQVSTIWKRRREGSRWAMSTEAFSLSIE